VTYLRDGAHEQDKKWYEHGEQDAARQQLVPDLHDILPRQVEF